MSSRHDPINCLSHIVEEAERLERFLDGIDRQTLEESGEKRSVVERCIERVCEAAHRLGQQAAELMPDQPWNDIRGMGNRLRHAYDSLDPDVVWRTARERVPALAAEAMQVLQRLRAERGDAG